MDHDDLMNRIHALIATSHGDGAALAQMEDTLTVGYAHALALEAERWRLEQRMGEVAFRLADGEDAASADDLASLARRVSDTDLEVVRLRAALASLRDLASEVRSAA